MGEALLQWVVGFLLAGDKDKGDHRLVRVLLERSTRDTELGVEACAERGG